MKMYRYKKKKNTCSSEADIFFWPMLNDSVFKFENIKPSSGRGNFLIKTKNWKSFKYSIYIDTTLFQICAMWLVFENSF